MSKRDYITQHDIIADIREQTNLSKNDVYAVYDGLIAGIDNALSEGKNVKLTRFCTFEIVDRPAHVSRNPRTGETVNVDAKKVIKVRNKKQLYDAGVAVTRNCA